jgi:hypothetical protein
MDALDLARANLLSPMVLAFAPKKGCTAEG